MARDNNSDKRDNRFTALMIVLLFLSVMLASVVALPWATQLHQVPTDKIATGLFEDYGFAFVVLGILLAAAILGGIYLAKMDEFFREEEP